jgi:hypothetical protein
MENLRFLLVALVCPLTMGLMMFFGMRGKRREKASDTGDDRSES